MRELTAGCDTRSASAARWKPPKVATARNVSTCEISTCTHFRHSDSRAGVRVCFHSDNIFLSDKGCTINFSYQHDQNVPFDAVQHKRQDHLITPACRAFCGCSGSEVVEFVGLHRREDGHHSRPRKCAHWVSLEH